MQQLYSTALHLCCQPARSRQDAVDHHSRLILRVVEEVQTVAAVRQVHNVLAVQGILGRARGGNIHGGCLKNPFSKLKRHGYLPIRFWIHADCYRLSNQNGKTLLIRDSTKRLHYSVSYDAACKASIVRIGEIMLFHKP